MNPSRLRQAVLAGLVGASLASGVACAATPAQVINVPFVNGGITSDEADVMRQQAARYPLEITLARRGETPGRNEFIADAQLRVIDSAGRVVLERGDTGPIFLASLPDGTYTLEATFNGQTKTQQVHVSGGRHAQVTFLWD
jgi:hypothetical protein